MPRVSTGVVSVRDRTGAPCALTSEIKACRYRINLSLSQSGKACAVESTPQAYSRELLIVTLSELAEARGWPTLGVPGITLLWEISPKVPTRHYLLMYYSSGGELLGVLGRGPRGDVWMHLASDATYDVAEALWSAAVRRWGSSGGGPPCV
jgi:hypothetical protein